MKTLLSLNYLIQQEQFSFTTRIEISEKPLIREIFPRNGGIRVQVTQVVKPSAIGRSLEINWNEAWQRNALISRGFQPEIRPYRPLSSTNARDRNQRTDRSVLRFLRSCCETCSDEKGANTGKIEEIARSRLIILAWHERLECSVKRGTEIPAIGIRFLWQIR